MSEQSKTNAEVRAELSELARPVAQELRRSLVQRETTRLAGLAGPCLLFPLIYLLVVAVAAPFGVDLHLPWLAVIGLAVAAPSIRIFLRWQSARKQQVSRAAALVAIDRAEQLQDRLSAAHEFVELAEPDGFQLAAIRDAQQRIAAARSARPNQPATAPQSTRSLTVSTFAAAVLLWCSAWIEVALPEGSSAIESELELVVNPRPATEQPAELESLPKPVPKPVMQRSTRQAKQAASSALSGEQDTPSEASRRGKNPMGSGRSAEARAAAGGGSERGQPSNQAQSTKGAPSSKPKPKKKKEPKKDPEAQAEEENKPPQESGSTLGRGSGKGSSKSPTASPWSAKDQVVSDDEQDLEEDEEIDDENDESKARGGVQPNLRQRKPPVNRDLQISMGSSKPSDDANGRGGPGGPKKQRGVAQLVLGVTFPDHVSADPNPGMSKITQERIEPQAQQGDSINGEGRGARAAPMGHLSRKVLSPWMQDLVRSFYLSLREKGGPQ